MDNYEEDFNFWPAFSDLMISVVLVLVVVVGTLQVRLHVADISTGNVRKQQEHLVRAFQHQPYRVHRDTTGARAVVEDADSGERMMAFATDSNPFLQRITFNDRLLFVEDHAELKDAGKTLLTDLGRALALTPSVREVQIRGHADTSRSIRFQSNLQLASARANAVFLHFVRDAKVIDPTRVLLSAASYAEYSPVGRGVTGKFDLTALRDANQTDIGRARNRRVEMLIFYSGGPEN